MSIYKDISGKIEAQIVEVLAVISNVAENCGIDFFIVGAKARDILFSAIFDIKTTRASLDIDLAIRVKSWDEVRNLIAALEAEGRFKAINEIKSRFLFDDSLLVDIVPFGAIEEPEGNITWPTGDYATMSTIGFEDAFESAVTVRLRQEPELLVKLSTGAGMVILKLIAWEDKFPLRASDAKDIVFIIKKYLQAGNEAKLFAEDNDLLEENGYDYDMAGARILGRDIAVIAESDTVGALLEILDKETSDASLHLATDMIRGSSDFEAEFEKTFELLRSLKLGIQEHKRHSSQP